MASRSHYRKVRGLPKRSMIVDVFRDYAEGLSAKDLDWTKYHLMAGFPLITRPSHDLLRGWPRKVVMAAERAAFDVPRNPHRYWSRYARTEVPTA